MYSLRLVFFLAIASIVMIELALSSPVDLLNISPRDTYSAGLGITYSPYKGSPGAASCKSDGEVAADVRTIHANGFKLVRLYGQDCDQVRKVLASCNSYGIKLMIGIYNVDDMGNEINTLCKTVGDNWSSIFAITVGNEFVLEGKKTPQQMVDLTNQARGLLRQKGYTGPVSCVEVFYEYLQNPTLCQGSDFITCNAHPYFDGSVEPQNAGPWLVEMIKQVSQKCGKQVLITETGWPTEGSANGICVPSIANQKTAIASIKQSCPNVILFTAFDDKWKANTASTTEEYWGVLDK